MTAIPERIILNQQEKEALLHAFQEEIERIKRAGGTHYGRMTLEECRRFLDVLRMSRIELVPPNLPDFPVFEEWRKQLNRFIIFARDKPPQDLAGGVC